MKKILLSLVMLLCASVSFAENYTESLKIELGETSFKVTPSGDFYYWTNVTSATRFTYEDVLETFEQNMSNFTSKVQFEECAWMFFSRDECTIDYDSRGYCDDYRVVAVGVRFDENENKVVPVTEMYEKIYTYQTGAFTESINMSFSGTTLTVTPSDNNMMYIFLIGTASMGKGHHSTFNNELGRMTDGNGNEYTQKGEYVLDLSNYWLAEEGVILVVSAAGYKWDDVKGEAVQITPFVQVSFTYSENGIATAHRRTELDHVGAYNFKTIENGKVVIVRDGEKYDLAGRKL